MINKGAYAFGGKTNIYNTKGTGNNASVDNEFGIKQNILGRNKSETNKVGKSMSIKGYYPGKTKVKKFII